MKTKASLPTNLPRAIRDILRKDEKVESSNIRGLLLDFHADSRLKPREIRQMSTVYDMGDKYFRTTEGDTPRKLLKPYKNTAKQLAPFLAFPSDADLQELNVTIPIVYSLDNE